MKNKFFTFLLVLCFIFPICATFWACSSGSSEQKATYSYEVDGNKHVRYFEGENFNIDGYVLKIRNDLTNEVKEITLTSDSIVKMPDMSTTGKKTIIVAHDGIRYSFTINVEDAEVKNQILLQKVNDFISYYKQQETVGDVSVNIDVDLITKYFSENGNIKTNINLFSITEEDISTDRLYDFLYETLVKNIVETNPSFTYGKDSYNYTFGFDIVSAYSKIAEQLQNFDYVDYLLNDVLFPGVKFQYVEIFTKDICNALQISAESNAYKKIETLINAKFNKVLNQEEINVEKFVDEFYEILQNEENVSSLTVDVSKILYDDLQNNKEHFVSELYSTLAKYTYFINDATYDEEYYNLVNENIPADLEAYLKSYITEHKKLFAIIEDYVFGKYQDFATFAEDASEQTSVIHDLITIDGFNAGFNIKYETPYMYEEIYFENLAYKHLSEILGAYQEDLIAYAKDIIKVTGVDINFVGNIFQDFNFTTEDCQIVVNLIWDLIENNTEADYEEYAKFILNKIIGYNKEDSAELANIIFSQMENPTEDFIAQIFKFYTKDNYKLYDENAKEVVSEYANDFLARFNEASSNHVKIYEKLIIEIFSTGSFDFNKYVFEIKDALKVLADLEDERMAGSYTIYKNFEGKWLSVYELGVYKCVYDIVALYEGEVDDFLISFAKEYNLIENLLLSVTENLIDNDDIDYLSNTIYTLLEGGEVDYEQFVFEFAEMIGICDENKIDYYLNDYRTNGYTTLISDFIRESLSGEDPADLKEKIVDIFEYIEKFSVQPIDAYILKDIAMVALESFNEEGAIEPMLYIALGLANSIVDGNVVDFVETNQLVEMIVNIICQEFALTEENCETLINYIYALIKGEEVDYEQLITDTCVMFGIYDEETITNYIKEYNERGTCSILSDFLIRNYNCSEEYKNFKQLVVDMALYLETIPVDGFDYKIFENKALAMLDELRKVATGGELMFADLVYAIYYNNPIGFLEDYEFIERVISNLPLFSENAQEVIADYFYDLLYNNSIDYESLVAKLCDAFGFVAEETVLDYINQYKENGYITILSDYFGQVDFENDKAYEPFMDILRYVEQIPTKGLDSQTLLKKIHAFLEVESEDNSLPENLKLIVRLLSTATNIDETIKNNIKKIVDYYQVEIEDIMIESVYQLLLLEVDSDGYKEVKGFVKNLVYLYLEDEIDFDKTLKDFNNIVELYCAENVKNNIKSIETVLLIMIGKTTEIDYNNLFAFVELPPAFQIEDYNKFITKITENATFENAIKISDVKVQYILDSEENIIGQTLRVEMNLDFDVSVSFVKGDVALNIQILF